MAYDKKLYAQRIAKLHKLFDYEPPPKPPTR
jgi:hypothetical protein